MARVFLFLTFMLPAASADAQPSRPFGAEPAWPAGDIAAVPARPNEAQPLPPPATSVTPGTRLRAPYRQLEQPEPASLEAERRSQQRRRDNPAAWRRDVLTSQQPSSLSAATRFRETQSGPALPDPE